MFSNEKKAKTIPKNEEKKEAFLLEKFEEVDEIEKK